MVIFSNPSEARECASRTSEFFKHSMLVYRMEPETEPKVYCVASCTETVNGLVIGMYTNGRSWHVGGKS